MQDDLAATAHYEAALYEDPGYEVEEYFSDWEYYSDDYYDDDPSVKQNVTRAKATDEATKERRARPAPGLANCALHPQSSQKLDTATFQSVVWKTASMDKDQDIEVQIYEPGNGEKLAFLANWREIFKSAQPALDKSRLRWRRVPKARVEGPCLADDERGHDEDDQPDNSDRMTDVLSSDRVNESGDTGDGSNTTPELPQSPKRAVRPSAGRGRKRKAEVPAEGTNQSNTGGSSTRARSKRVALDNDNDSETKSGGSPAPVRRSTRQRT